MSGKFVQFSDGYSDPKDPSYDRGNCPQNRRAIGSFTVGYVTPQFGNTVLRTVASDWRASGIMTTRSGDWLTVTTTQDLAGTGVTPTRNQLKDDAHGDKTRRTTSVASAFARPGGASPGSERARSIEARVTERRSGGRAPRPWGRPDDRSARRDVQPAEPFQLGQPATSLDAGTSAALRRRWAPASCSSL